MVGWCCVCLFFVLGIACVVVVVYVAFCCFLNFVSVKQYNMCFLNDTSVFFVFVVCICVCFLSVVACLVFGNWWYSCFCETTQDVLYDWVVLFVFVVWCMRFVCDLLLCLFVWGLVVFVLFVSAKQNKIV